MYKEDCPSCIGDGYFDLYCPYCDDNISKENFIKQLNSKEPQKLTLIHGGKDDSKD